MIAVFMKCTLRAATSSCLLEEQKQEGRELNTQLIGNFYRSSIIGINYVQYKPFIQIRLRYLIQYLTFDQSVRQSDIQ